MASAEQDARLRERLLYDTPYYSEHAPLMIVDKSKRLVPFTWKKAQRRLHEVVEVQRKAGKPIRVIILKARQIGFSTAVESVITQRVTQMPNHSALVIAHRKRPGKKLFAMFEKMYANLPPDLKPTLTSFRRNEEMAFGEASVAARLSGDFGLDTSIAVDTATELGSGRGETFSELHCSELAFWPDIEEKLSSLLEAVPDDPETAVFLESTANGDNHWKTLCDQAMEGQSEFVFLFVGWWEDDGYEVAFTDAAERQEFIDSVGEVERARPETQLREAEPALLELFEQNGIDYEAQLRKLNWRRKKIASPSIAFDLQKFMREYPATPEDAFLSSENTVFSTLLVQKVVNRTRDTDPLAEDGIFTLGGQRTRRGRLGDVEVPTSALWVPREKTGFGPTHDFWRIWEHPYRMGEDLPALNPDRPEEGPAIAKWDGQYNVTVDAAGDATINNEEGDADAIVVTDHRTGRQVAEYMTRRDADEIAIEAMFAALYWNDAWISVEKTGNYGVPILQILQYDFGYPFIYRRPRTADMKDQKESDRIGWDTQSATKRILIAHGKELLRTNTDGIRSLRIARQMTWFVKDERGRSGARKGKLDDLLMAWLISRQTARETPLRPDRKPGTSHTSWVHKPTDSITGW